jgi:hypothetical protein
MFKLKSADVGYLWIAFDRRKEGWHDEIANSVVGRPAGIESVKFLRRTVAPREWVDPGT